MRYANVIPRFFNQAPEICMQGNRSRALLAVFFIVAGCLHFIFPTNYMRVMPPWLPAHLGLVLVSGGFEIVGGIKLISHVGQNAPVRSASGTAAGKTSPNVIAVYGLNG